MDGERKKSTPYFDDLLFFTWDFLCFHGDECTLLRDHSDDGYYIFIIYNYITLSYVTLCCVMSCWHPMRIFNLNIECEFTNPQIHKTFSNSQQWHGPNNGQHLFPIEHPGHPHYSNNRKNRKQRNSDRQQVSKHRSLVLDTGTWDWSWTQHAPRHTRCWWWWWRCWCYVTLLLMLLMLFMLMVINFKDVNNNIGCYF